MYAKILITVLFFISVFYNFNNLYSQKLETTYFKNLHRLNDTIYRSDQPDSLDIGLLKELGIKSILNLRNFHYDTVFMGSKTNFKLYNVKMKAYYITNKKIIKAMKIIEESPKPLLIHCKHGSDRTGVIIAMYRILYGGWTKKDALKELKSKEYGFHDIFFNIPFYIRKVNTTKLAKKISQ